jgi:hypothetical protein
MISKGKKQVFSRVEFQIYFFLRIIALMGELKLLCICKRSLIEVRKFDFLSCHVFFEFLKRGIDFSLNR